MNQIEHTLADTLRQRAGDRGPEPDPWERFVHGERASRRRRRRRTVGTIAGLVAAAALVQTNAVPLPRWVPAVTLNAPAAESPLLGLPTRGSLANEQAWLHGLRQAVDDISEDEGVWRVEDRDDIRIVYAGDVGGQRIALLVVPLRLGLIRVEQAMFYGGPQGARAEEMEQGESFDGVPPVVARMVGDVGDSPETAGGLTEPPTLLLVAPPGATANTRRRPSSAPTGGCGATGVRPR